jgi:hypothetical protein
MGIGALAKLGKSIGRELFGFLLRSDLNVAKIAEGAGDDAGHAGSGAP